MDRIDDGRLDRACHPPPLAALEATRSMIALGVFIAIAVGAFIWLAVILQEDARRVRWNDGGGVHSLGDDGVDGCDGGDD